MLKTIRLRSPLSDDLKGVILTTVNGKFVRVNSKNNLEFIKRKMNAKVSRPYLSVFAYCRNWTRLDDQTIIYSPKQVIKV